MRISSSMLFDSGVAAINRQQSDLLKTQQQLSSGTRILTPQDDPIGASRAIEVSQAQAANAQYAKNREQSANRLGFVDTALQRVSDLIQNARAMATSAGNPTLSNADRASLAVELQSMRDELVGFANSTDDSGQYLFSGYRVDTAPFAGGTGGVTYSGDQGQRLVQVSNGRTIAISEPGSEVFERIRDGNGTFSALPDPANTGSGVVNGSSVVSPSALTGDAYRIAFTSANTYDVIDTTTAATVSSGNAYVSGNAITFAGMQVQLTGAPANGDRFNVTPSSSQSLFKTVDDLTQLLSQPVNAPVDKTRLTNGLNSALQNLDRALDNVLAVRASVGSRMKELDVLNTAGDALSEQYSQTLSQLRDVDYASAATRLTQQQMHLQAAQQSFLKVSQLSLFDYF